MKLPERLGRRPRKPFHSAITTTFAVEFAAVEEILLPQLRASGANNLLLVADDRMAAMALNLFRKALSHHQLDLRPAVVFFCQFSKISCKSGGIAASNASSSG